MSSIIQSRVPFLHRSILCQALKEMGIRYHMNGDLVDTEISDNYGTVSFRPHLGRYIPTTTNAKRMPRWGKIHLSDSEEQRLRLFLDKLSDAYQLALNENNDRLRRAEEERLAAEEAERLKREADERETARLAFIQQQEQTIIERAKADGYHVTRKEIGGKIRLTLSRIR